LIINSSLKGTDTCADYQVIHSNYTSGIEYSFGLKNVYNANTTGYGVGIKLSLGGSGETGKWVGIAACAASAYANATDLVFNFNATERVRFTSSGNVGIGTTSPSYKLDVSGNCGATNFYTTSDRSKKQDITILSNHIRKFQLKDSGKYAYGVIAQEVEEMFRDGEDGNMTVNYNSVLSYYVGSLENSVAGL
jgi:hypothetical protein